MLKKGDFVKIEYTGYDKNGNIFDSTEGEISKKLRNKEGAILVVYGRGQLISGLEEVIKEMKEGEEKEISIEPEKAFGKKKKELLNIMKEEEFRKHKVDPKPGSTVHVDFGNNRVLGLIKSVTSGRVLIDFNHPLAGQKVKYKIKIVSIISNKDKKINALIEEAGLDCTPELIEDTLTLKSKKSKEMKDEEFNLKKKALENAVNVFVPEVKKIEFEE